MGILTGFSKSKQRQAEFENYFFQLVDDCLSVQLYSEERRILEDYRRIVNSDNFKIETPRLERNLSLASALILKEGEFPSKSVSDLILVMVKNAKYCQIAPRVIPFPW